MNQQYYYGTGRRKTSVARVRIYGEKGPIIINSKPMEESYSWESWKRIILEPFKVTDTLGQYRVVAKVTGGGVVGRCSFEDPFSVDLPMSAGSGPR